jgi:hypothetical protein
MIKCSILKWNLLKLPGWALNPRTVLGEDTDTEQMATRR